MPLTAERLRTTPAYLKKLAAAGVSTPLGLLEHFPRALEDRSNVLRHFAFVDLREKNSVAATLDFFGTERTKFGKQILKAVLRDEGGNLCEAVWFGRQFWAAQFKPGDRVLVYGKPAYKFGRLSFPSPDLSRLSADANLLVPVYPELSGISSDWFAGKIALCRDALDDAYDLVPDEIRRKNGHRTRRENLEAVHFPKSRADWERARRELAYDELFGYQYAGLQRKGEGDAVSEGRVFSAPLHAAELKETIAALPFALTDHQRLALFAILKDMSAGHAMNRLLQGDVGTGKTVVAFLACWHAAKFSGAQSAVMAPTSVLANQHYASAKKFFEPRGMRVGLLTGELKKSEQDAVKAAAAAGEIDVLVGTHALVVEGVRFRALGLAVIDEQHRFGVDQRRVLETKNSPAPSAPGEPRGLPRVPHVLYMTATPIPRTLTLTLYGDQDVSVIRQYPAGRRKIVTRVFPETGRLEAFRFVESQVAAGRQAYWVSPLVEESAELGYADVLRTTAMLRDAFPDVAVGMVHGRMKPDEKASAMAAFKSGETKILSATSVIEVGVDNPNATVMCVEGAERFGLSQLHQLRGRVGRGEHQSYCFLFAGSGAANARLDAMESTDDGFELAELDLELRGPGEVWGLRQSGVPDFQIADLRDLELISKIRDDVSEWMKK